MSYEVVFRDNFTKQSEWSEVLKHDKYDNLIKKAIRKERNKTFLKRFINHIGAALIGVSFIWSALQLEGKGKIILFIIGGLFLSYCLANFRDALLSIFDRLETPPKKNLKKLVEFFYKQHEDIAGITDWASAYSCLSPYTTTKINIQEFSQSWGNSSASYSAPLEAKLRSILKRCTAECETCGDSNELFVVKGRYSFLNMLNRAEYDFIQCNKCSRQYCKKCITKNNLRICKCGNDNLAYPPFTFLLKKPCMQMVPVNPDNDKAVIIDITEDTPESNIAKVTWSRNYNCVFFVCLESYTYQETLSSPSKGSSIEFGVSVTVENHAVQIGNKWYLVAPTLGDTVEVSK